jgi:hypothetical protein
MVPPAPPRTVEQTELVQDRWSVSPGAVLFVQDVLEWYRSIALNCLEQCSDLGPSEHSVTLWLPNNRPTCLADRAYQGIPTHWGMWVQQKHHTLSGTTCFSCVGNSVPKCAGTVGQCSIKYSPDMGWLESSGGLCERHAPHSDTLSNTDTLSHSRHTWGDITIACTACCQTDSPTLGWDLVETTPTCEYSAIIARLVSEVLHITSMLLYLASMFE